MKHKATIGQLQLKHNDLRRLLMRQTIEVSIENTQKVNFILELSLEQFDSIADQAEFIRAISMDEPPEVKFDLVKKKSITHSFKGFFL